MDFGKIFGHTLYFVQQLKNIQCVFIELYRKFSTFPVPTVLDGLHIFFFVCEFELSLNHLLLSLEFTSTWKIRLCSWEFPIIAPAGALTLIDIACADREGKAELSEKLKEFHDSCGEYFGFNS